MKTAKLTAIGVAALLLTAAGCEPDEIEESRLPDISERATDANEVPELDERRTPDVDLDHRAGETSESGVDRPQPELQPRPDAKHPASEEIEVPEPDDSDRGLDGPQETDR